MEMVDYWKTKEYISAKVTKAKDGSTIMILEGEKYPLSTFPRGYLLFGQLSKLKHEIKNQVFNESWKKLEEGKLKEEIIADVKKTLFSEITKYYEPMKYDMLPPSSMCPPVREIYRAWTKIAPESTYILRDYLCLILQEDDSYRFRVMWLVKYFNPSKWWFHSKTLKVFNSALSMLEHGEVIGDMKERQRLLRRVLMMMLEDKRIRELFEKFCKEVDWNKVKLTKGDLYHFRGKYFKADLDLFEY